MVSYPKMVTPDPTWVQQINLFAQQMPDFPPPLSTDANARFNSTYCFPHWPQGSNVVDQRADSCGGGWTVTVQNAAEEAAVTSPRVPPLS